MAKSGLGGPILATKVDWGSSFGDHKWIGGSTFSKQIDWGVLFDNKKRTGGPLLVTKSSFESPLLATINGVGCLCLEMDGTKWMTVAIIIKCEFYVQRVTLCV